MAEPPVTTRFLVLQTLLLGESYGVEIANLIQERTRGQIKVRQGALYPALRSLERDGLILSFEKRSSAARAGRPRRYYSLTAAGTKEADATRSTVAQLLGSAPTGLVWSPA